MKKTLVAMAVLAASGAAMAQSNVTLYGIVDVWVGQTSNTTAAGVKTSLSKVDSGGLGGSRWGMSGSEDLGGGLKAIFRLEQGFNADDGTDAVSGFNRNAYVGLEGGFGTVIVGKTWTAMDDVIGASNSGFDSALSATRGVTTVNQGRTSTFTGSYADSPGNTIKYTSPSFGGVSGSASYSLDETAGVKNDTVDFSLSYGAGPVAANVAYQTRGDFTGTDDLKLTVLNGSYDLGVAKLLASYGQVKLAAAKTTEFQIGADFPLSAALTLSVGFAQSKENAAGANEKRTGYSIAAGYSLSKRTTAYAGYRQAEVKNSSEKDSLVAVGIRHAF